MTDLLPGISLRHVDTARVRTGVLVDDRTEGEVVVLVHGNVSSSIFWQETMLGLPQGFRAIAPDLRGFGATETAPVDATRGLADFSDDLIALLDALGIEKAHLVGWSMGGGVVSRLLLDAPERVSSLTLVAPVSPYGFGGTKGADGVRTTDDDAGTGGGGANPEFVAALQAGDRGDESPNSARNVMNGFYVADGFRSPLEEAYVDSMLTTAVGEDNYPGDLVASDNWPGFAAGTRGVLRVGTTPTLGADVLPPSLAAFRTSHPEVRLTLTASGNSSELRRAVADGVLDLAVAVVPDALEDGLVVGRRARQVFVAVVPADDPAVGRGVLARSALTTRPIVALSRGEGLRAVLETVFAAAGAVPDIAIETSEREMLIPFVAAGLGVTVVPRAFARQRAGLGTAVLPLRPSVHREVGVVVREGQQDPLVTAFGELVAFV